MSLTQGSPSPNILGTDSYFKGVVRLAGALHVDGCYEGESIDADMLTIGKTGKVKAKVNANLVIVEGILIGDIRAKYRVLLLPTARILGNIESHELVIQKGVLFSGSCTIKSLDLDNVEEVIRRSYEGLDS